MPADTALQVDLYMSAEPMKQAILGAGYIHGTYGSDVLCPVCWQPHATAVHDERGVRFEHRPRLVATGPRTGFQAPGRNLPCRVTTGPHAAPRTIAEAMKQVEEAVPSWPS